MILSSCEESVKFHTCICTCLSSPFPKHSTLAWGYGCCTNVLKPAGSVAQSLYRLRPKVQSQLWLLLLAIEVLLLGVGFAVAPTQLVAVSFLLTTHRSSVVVQLSCIFRFTSSVPRPHSDWPPKSSPSLCDIISFLNHFYLIRY